MKVFQLFLYLLAYTSVNAANEAESQTQVPDMMFAGVIIGFLTLVYFSYFFLKSRNKKKRSSDQF